MGFPTLVTIILTSWGAGLMAFLGGMIAKLEFSAESKGKNELIHGIVAFGGGILVAAVAFALVPEGIASLSPVHLALSFTAGGILFCMIEARLSKTGGSKGQFMAMLLDFVPEAIALGAVFSHDQKTGMLLALFMGAQNLPEGFNAFRENVASGSSEKSSLITLLAVSVLGPISALMGYLFLEDRPVLTASIMSVAAGGILYLIFQDIAPKSTMKRHWTPPLGAVLGFVVGMIGKQLLG